MVKKRLGVDHLPPFSGTMLFGMPCILISDPDALEDVYIKKNSAFTKHEIERSFGYPLLLNNIISMETEDPEYKKKRKALSAAFLRSKMDLIMHNIKDTALRTFELLQAKGDVNEVDLNIYTTEVQANIIISIILGPGYAFDTLDHIDLKTGETEKMTVSKFMSIILEEIMQKVTSSPFASFNTKSELLAIDKHFCKNYWTLREYFGAIIDSRKKKTS